MSISTADADGGSAGELQGSWQEYEPLVVQQGQRASTSSSSTTSSLSSFSTSSASFSSESSVDSMAESAPREEGSLLPTHLMIHILKQLPPNDIAWNARLSCKDANTHLAQQGHTTVLLSKPLSICCALAWVKHATDTTTSDPFDELTFVEKLQLLSTAATSGCTANLVVAWALVQPHLIPDVPPWYYYKAFPHGLTDPGTAAATAGHPHLIHWLYEHGCPLLPYHTLAAVARHCDLADLQSVWEMLPWDLYEERWWHEGYGRWTSPLPSSLHDVAAAAAASSVDAIPKLQWMVSEHRPRILTEDVAKAAAARGDMGVLRWLQEQRPGRLCTPTVLAAALQHADLSVAEWLVGQAAAVGEAGGEAASNGLFTDRGAAIDLCYAAGASGSVGKLRWLLAHGVLVTALGDAVQGAAAHGQLRAVQHLVGECRVQLSTPRVFTAAVSSGHVPTASWLLTRGCPVDGRRALAAAPLSDGLEMMTWLLRDSGVPYSPDLTITDVLVGRAMHTAAQRAQVRDAVRLLISSGVPVRWLAVFHAAQLGNLHLVKVLMQVCGVSPLYILPYSLPRLRKFHANTGGCAALIAWLYGAGYEDTDGGSWAWVAAARRGDAATVRLLRRLGVGPTESTLSRAVQMFCALPVLQWLVEQGVPASGRALKQALVAANEVSGCNMWFGPIGARLKRAEAQELKAWLQGMAS